MPAQIALLPSLVVAAPNFLETHHRGRRQARRVGTEQGLERLCEIARRDPFQVQPGNQFLDALRAPQVGRQDLGGETELAPLFIDATVVDTRGPDFDRADAADESTFLGAAVAHDQPPALLVDCVLMGFDVGGDLGLDGGHQHLTGSLVQQLVERRGLVDRSHIG